jgi:hypothetical protein
MGNQKLIICARCGKLKFQYSWCSCEDNEGNENPYLDCTGDGQ